ncbi:MAG: IS66 family transposase [Ruthenibacterium lactatiformans]
MENYLQDARCRISNKLAENAIRPFMIGRKKLAVQRHCEGGQYCCLQPSGDCLRKRSIHIVLSNLPATDFCHVPRKLPLRIDYKFRAGCCQRYSSIGRIH